MTRNCPTDNELSKFAIGDLPNTRRVSQIEAHLEGCPTCRVTVEEMGSVGNGLVAALRRAPAESNYSDEPGCQLALENSLKHAKRIFDDQATAIASSDSDTNPDAGESDPLIGTEIGQYRLVSVLAVGGMGVVYRATHKKLKRDVALKLIHPRRSGSDEARKRFLREMEVVGSLANENIVAASDAGEVDGKHYLVMELLEGIDVSQLLRRVNRLEVADACEIIRQAAIGVAYIDRNGLVHRDLKPSNLMLVSSPQDARVVVKILDLGLARIDDEAAGFGGSVTSTSQMMGTIDYMAPEQCLDSHDVDVRSDIYSLGASLYRMLAGETLWSREKYSTSGQKLKAVLSDPIPSVAQQRSDLPQQLIAIVDRAIERDRERRFDRPQQLADALAPLAAGHRLDELLQRGMTGPTWAETATEVATTRDREDDRNNGSRWRSSAAVWLGGLGFLIIGIWIYLGGAASFLGTDSPGNASLPSVTSTTETLHQASELQSTDSGDANTADTGSASERISLTRGLVCLLTFEEPLEKSVPDCSGNGSDAIASTNAADRLVPGPPLPGNQHAFEFRGRDECLELSNSEGLSFTEQMTIAMWYRGDVLPDSVTARLVNKVTTTDGYVLKVRGWKSDAPGTVMFNVVNQGRRRKPALSETNVVDGKWHHIAGTFDSSELNLFIDGKLEASVRLKLPIGVNDLPLRIGTRDESELLAAIDEVCLFDRALTAAEIDMLGRSRPEPLSSD